MKALEANKLSDNTIVIFTSDNGCSRRADFENLHTQNHYPSAHLRGSKSDIWDGGPLIMTVFLLSFLKR